MTDTTYFNASNISIANEKGCPFILFCLFSIRRLIQQLNPWAATLHSHDFRPYIIGSCDFRLSLLAPAIPTVYL